MRQGDPSTGLAWADLLSWGKALIGFLVLIFTGLLTWIVNKHVKRLENLESTSVTHDDLQLLRKEMDDRHADRQEDLQQLREDMERRHAENAAKLDTIDGGVTRTHQRIDDLYRDLLGRER